MKATFNIKMRYGEFNKMQVYLVKSILNKHFNNKQIKNFQIV